MKPSLAFKSKRYLPPAIDTVPVVKRSFDSPVSQSLSGWLKSSLSTRGHSEYAACETVVGAGRGVGVIADSTTEQLSVKPTRARSSQGRAPGRRKAGINTPATLGRAAAPFIWRQPVLSVCPDRPSQPPALS